MLHEANQLLVNQSPNGLVNSWKWYKTKLLWLCERPRTKLAHATGRDFEYEFYVVLDDDLNAFALPGGKCLSMEP